MHKLTWIGLVFGAVVGLTGCPRGGVSDTPDATLVPGGVVKLGTGALTWEPLTDEQELGLVTGPQGGHHFIVNVRMREMAPGDPADPISTPSTRFSVFTEDGRQIDLMAPAYRLAYEDDGDGWYTLPSGRILQIYNEEVPAIYGQRVRIRVQVIDKQGLIATDEHWVVVFDYCARYPDGCQFG